MPDGATVVVVAREQPVDSMLSPEDEAELLQSIAEADCGATIGVTELFERLDRLR